MSRDEYKQHIDNLDKFTKRLVYLDWWINHKCFAIQYPKCGWVDNELATSFEVFCENEIYEWYKNYEDYKNGIGGYIQTKKILA